MNIVYSRPDGRIIIITPAKKEHLELILGPLTDEKYKAHIWEKSVPKDAINPQYINLAPEDRYFRNAWKHDGERITIDMNKACEIHMNKIRSKRDAELKRLDIETLKGIDVQNQKQILRDLPQTFDLSKAQTPEELKTLWPEELKHNHVEEKLNSKSPK